MVSDDVETGYLMLFWIGKTADWILAIAHTDLSFVILFSRKCGTDGIFIKGGED